MEQRLLGRNIRRLRDRHDLTQQQLAERAGVSRSAIARLESGESESAETSTLRALASALNEPIGELFVEVAGEPQPEAPASKEIPQ